MFKFATIAVAVLLLSGCANTSNTAAEADRADVRNAEVRTGTRLPPRNSTPNTAVKTVSGEDYKQDANRTIGDAPRGN